MSEKKEIQELMQNNKTILIRAPMLENLYFTHYTKVCN